MPSAEAPPHEIVVADSSTPDLLAQCINLRIAGMLKSFFMN